MWPDIWSWRSKCWARWEKMVPSSLTGQVGVLATRLTFENWPSRGFCAGRPEGKGHAFLWRIVSSSVGLQDIEVHDFFQSPFSECLEMSFTWDHYPHFPFLWLFLYPQEYGDHCPIIID